jgi:co-chaperonin GroES (HSP10)
MEQKTHFSPLWDYLLVAQVRQVVTRGGIEVPSMAEDPLPKAIVVAAGPGRDGEPMQVAVGDIVTMEGAPLEVTIDGQVYGITRQTNCMGKIDGLDMACHQIGMDEAEKWLILEQRAATRAARDRGPSVVTASPGIKLS